MRGPSGSSGPAGRIREFLAARGAPASSVMLVERFLRASVASEELATRLLRPILEPEGLAYEEASGWKPPARAGAAPRRVIAVTIDPGADRAIAAGVDLDRVARPLEAIPGGLSGAIAVMADPRHSGPLLRMWLHRRGIAAPDAIVSLASVARRAVRVPRGAGLDRICALLGVRWLEGDRMEDATEALAACVARAMEGAAGREPAMPDTPDPAAPAGIEDLPSSPGTYRFYDGAGALIYVGKAKNLRRRVSSYFGARRAGGHGARFLDRVHRVEYEEEGSDLEALLAEARLIDRLAPDGNVQVQVRERHRRYEAARAFALILGRGGGGATVIVVEGGRYRGHAVIGPRGGGLRAARRLIAHAIGGGDRRVRGGPRPGGVDRDTQILNSWIARHGDAASRLDLDGFADLDAAIAALAQAAASIAEDPGPVVFRSR